METWSLNFGLRNKWSRGLIGLLGLSSEGSLTGMICSLGGSMLILIVYFRSMLSSSSSATSSSVTLSVLSSFSYSLISSDKLLICTCSISSRSFKSSASGETLRILSSLRGSYSVKSEVAGSSLESLFLSTLVTSFSGVELLSLIWSSTIENAASGGATTASLFSSYFSSIST